MIERKTIQVNVTILKSPSAAEKEAKAQRRIHRRIVLSLPLKEASTTTKSVGKSRFAKIQLFFFIRE